jgi:hypothetical protein
MDTEHLISIVQKMDTILNNNNSLNSACCNECKTYISSQAGLDWTNPHNNPHIAEVFLNDGQEYKTDIKFERILTESANTKEYARRVDMEKTIIHWGQRKLLLSEIEFLTLIGKRGLENATVVYAGAAPGTHIDYLARLFPDVKFVLVDPAPFSIKHTTQDEYITALRHALQQQSNTHEKVPNIHPIALQIKNPILDPKAREFLALKDLKIVLLRDLFTDDYASLFSEIFQTIYFVSDIRTADPDKDDKILVESKIQSDMRAQERWHYVLQSKRSMLKFRLPWDLKLDDYWAPKHTSYLDGDIYLPVWGPPTTTECRLITRGDGRRIYDNKKIENQMFYFNTVARHSLYPHNVRGVRGLDHCYDCTAETDILYRYICEFEPTNPKKIDKVAQMSKDITDSFPGKRTLADPNPDKEERLNGIRRRQEINNMPAHEYARWVGINDHRPPTRRTERWIPRRFQSPPGAARGGNVEQRAQRPSPQRRNNQSPSWAARRGNARPELRDQRRDGQSPHELVRGVAYSPQIQHNQR